MENRESPLVKQSNSLTINIQKGNNHRERSRGMKQDFESFLMEQHAKDFIGTKETIIDDFNGWIENLTVDDWLRLGDLFKAS